MILHLLTSAQVRGRSALVLYHFSLYLWALYPKYSSISGHCCRLVTPLLAVFGDGLLFLFLK